MIVSTVKKSKARIPFACDLRNSLHVGPDRRGAGPSPFARSRVRILVAETLMPSLASSPRIRMHPHRGFSLPIRRMRSRTSSGIGGLPPADLPRKVHFLRTRSRCQRRSVWELTTNQLVTKDHYLDFGVHLFVGGASDQPQHAAQQQVHESEEQGPNLPREGGPILRTRWSRRRSTVSVPFTRRAASDPACGTAAGERLGRAPSADGARPAARPPVPDRHDLTGPVPGAASAKRSRRAKAAPCLLSVG